MKFLEAWDQANTMNTHPAPAAAAEGPHDDISSANLSSLSLQDQPASPLTTSSKDDFEHLSYPSASDHSLSSSLTSTQTSSSDKKARLLYCKSHVAIHPTTFNKDNISGYLGIVEVDSPVPHSLAPTVTPDTEGNLKGSTAGLLVVWVPDEVLERMDEQDREGYKRMEKKINNATTQAEHEEDGFVFVSLPPPRGEKYAFSIPVSSIYSILVYPPSLSHWYGSATLNLMGGISLPTLYFHDDESPLLASPKPSPDQQVPRSKWGFPPFLQLLQSRATLLRSRLLHTRQMHGAELWLVNPSKTDREVHEHAVEEPPKPRTTTTPPAQAQRRTSTIPSSSPEVHTPRQFAATPYPPKPYFPNAAVLNQSTPKQTLLTSLSNLTNLSRKTAQQLLAHPVAQPLVPHLPPAVRTFVNAPGEWERSGKLPSKTGAGGDVASEFESARLYLARWARVVAEEGERARRNEVARQADLSQGVRVGSEDLASSLGVFSLLTSPNSKRAIPHPTRTPQHPITARDWELFAAQGRDELWVRREIFRRGFSDSNEDVEKQCRREGWEVLLRVVPWSLGGFGDGEVGKTERRRARESEREKKRAEYAKLKTSWQDETRQEVKQQMQDEWHRIDDPLFITDSLIIKRTLLGTHFSKQVDCRRTDRNQAIFAVSPEIAQKGDQEKEAGGAGGSLEEKNEETGSMAALNSHIAALRTVLMTYHIYRPELGYVQGMSDLLSPTYVVFGANEADAFWGLVGIMKMMESNFLRDQSGMKRQLSMLQQLIGVMDPELYAHLERTGSLNLFFCFRWILIAFKREFKFEQVIRLWEVLWTNYYSTHFVLFVALAILQSHRDVIMRYLNEFDEVLKYANDLSGTIDLDTTLAQAEVLFLSFRGLVEDLDHDHAIDQESGEGSTLRRRRLSASSSSSKSGSARTAAQSPPKPVISDDLRALLKSWTPA